MAEKRMFSKIVVESARFLKMPLSSQALYFHLGLNADDDGVVEAYSVLRLTNTNEDDLKVLCGKGFVTLLNTDLVTFINDWRINNGLRADRKKDSLYQKLLLKVIPDVQLLEKKERSDRKKSVGQSVDSPWTAQCSVGKNSVDKYSIGECSTVNVCEHTPLYKLDNEVITNTEYKSLVDLYSKTVVDGVIDRIMSKPYHGCLNVKKISEWCREHANESKSTLEANKESIHSAQLEILASETAGD